MNLILPKQTSGPLTGYPVLNIDQARFIEYLAKCMEMQIGYGDAPGQKDPHPGAWPPDYKNIDCSGFFRTWMDYATHGQTADLAIPDGSWNQDAWLSKLEFKRTLYTNAALKDNHIRVAVHLPGGRGGDPDGHIWTIQNALTGESWGHHGPGRRPWNTQKLLDIVDHTYVLC